MGKVNKIYLILGVIIIVHILILLNLVFAPYPELFIYSYLTENGLTPYSQIMDQHFPGLMLSPVNFFTFGFDNLSSMRGLHLGLIVLNHALIFLLAKKLFGSESNALTSNFLYLLFQPYYEGYVLWIESLVAPILTASFYFLIRNRSKKDMFYSGLLIGLALVFKQVVAPIILVLIVYLYLNKKDWLRFALGAAITASLVLINSLYYQNFTDLFYWTATFNLTTFAEMGRKYPTLGNVIKIVPTVGLAGLVSLYLFYKKKGTHDKKLLSLFFLSSLIFAYARFDHVHLQPALIFVVLLVPILILKLDNFKRIILTLVYVAFSVYLTIPVIRFYQNREYLYFGSHEQNVAEKVMALTNPGDRIFSMATTPQLYYMTDTLPPGDVFVFHFPWFMVEAEDKILVGIKQDQPVIVARDKSASTSGMNLVSYMPKINQYVDEHYQTVEMIGEVEIMIKK